MYLTNNGIINEPNEGKPGYLKLITVKNSPENNNQTNRNSKFQSLALKPDLYKNTAPATSDVITNDKNLNLYQENQSENSGYTLESMVDSTETNKITKKDKAYSAIDKTRNVISIANTIAKVTNNTQFETLLNSTDGALTASRAIIDIDNVKHEENNTKKIISSVSQVASGVGTVLSAVDIPEAEFLRFTGQVMSLGVEQQNLGENIKKKDARGIAGHSVSIVKGSWGVVVSGVEAAKIAANLGAKVGLVNVATVGKITTTSTKISNFADKVAIPFAIAGTGLTLWDWSDSNKKVNYKKEEIAHLKEQEADSNYDTYKELRADDEPNKAVAELKTLKLNSTIRGVSFGLSAVSTSAMIASAISPNMRFVGPIALGASIASSIVTVVADDKKRQTIVDTYGIIKNGYKNTISEVSNFIFQKEKI